MIPRTGRCLTGPAVSEAIWCDPFGYSTGLSCVESTAVLVVPAHAGQALNEDTDGDGIPDRVAGCGETSLRAGAPLTGAGFVRTTGTGTTWRSPLDPRGFTLPAGALARENFASYEIDGYPFIIHEGALENATGQFARSGGDGSFDVSHTGSGARRAVQVAGPNRFGGVMRLLGDYSSVEANRRGSPPTTFVGRFGWMLQYLGNGGQATQAGVVTAGYMKSALNYSFSMASGYPATSTVVVEAFKWTTGTVRVTATEGPFPTLLERRGHDARTGFGAGQVQLVSPMLTHWVGEDSSTTGGIGVLRITFTPEPAGASLLAAGVALLALLARARAARRRVLTRSS